MNKEFIYISDDKVAVSDECGHITIREGEGNMKNILTEEDKIEDLKSTIERLVTGIKLEKVSIDMIDKWYKIMAGMVIGAAIVGPVMMGIVGGLKLTLGAAVVAALSSASGVFVQRQAVKRINGYNKEIKRAKKLQQIAEDNLNNYREMNEQYNVKDSLVGEVIQTNSPDELYQQNQKLRTAFKVGYKKTPKVLVKTMNNVKR